MPHEAREPSFVNALDNIPSTLDPTRELADVLKISHAAGLAFLTIPSRSMRSTPSAMAVKIVMAISEGDIAMSLWRRIAKAMPTSQKMTKMWLMLGK